MGEVSRSSHDDYRFLGRLAWQIMILEQKEAGSPGEKKGHEQVFWSGNNFAFFCALSRHLCNGLVQEFQAGSL